MEREIEIPVHVHQLPELENWQYDMVISALEKTYPEYAKQTVDYIKKNTKSRQVDTIVENENDEDDVCFGA